MKNLSNYLLYLFKRNNWMLDPRLLLSNFQEYNINKPIFLLGNQGGGLTLLSRMLRRHKNIVNCTGNHKYWTGADEMQNVFGPMLPFSLTGIKYKVPEHPIFKSPRGWSYAIDDSINIYRKTEKDFNSSEKAKLEHLIKYFMYRFGDKSSRFIDKSQVYTVRMSYIYSLLKDYKPKFVLLTRNPYAEVYRTAQGVPRGMKPYINILSWDDRLKYAAQHWKNSMHSVLEDKENNPEIDLLIVKFEDLLSNPEETLQKICDHVDLIFNDDLLPKAEHSIPFGSRYDERWYPLIPEINKKYIGKISNKDIDIIQNICGDVAEKLGYNDTEMRNNNL